MPGIKHWPSLESRIERNLKELLDVLDNYSVKVTFFWLGWLAERHKNLVRMCRDAGHEIASHGYAHILAYEVGPNAFREDITKAKDILENVISDQIRGFRAPGFSITEKAPWAFEVIKESGYQYKRISRLAGAWWDREFTFGPILYRNPQRSFAGDSHVHY